MRVRVYIAIILLLLLLTVSQVCASGASRLSKKPTYKIRAFNSINKATKVTIIGSGPGCPYGLNSRRSGPSMLGQINSSQIIFFIP